MRRLELALALAMLAAACSADGDGGGFGGRDGATGGGRGGASGAGGAGGNATGGAGGSASGGSGGGAGSGGSSAGSGGAAGGGGSNADAAPTGGTGGSGLDGSVSGDAAADAGPPMTCTLDLAPLSPQRWSDLPAVAGHKLRVGARLSGVAAPAVPMWRWLITHASGQVIPHGVVDGDEAVVEFETQMVGQYTISVQLLNGGPPCPAAPLTRPASAIPPTQRAQKFRILATPPAGRELAPLEIDVLVNAGAPAARTVEFQPPFRVTVEAQDEGGHALPGYYVQIKSLSTTARLERYVDTSVPAGQKGLQARLDASDIQDRFYDVLLVPDAVGGVARAPKLFPGLAAPAGFQLQKFVVDPGVTVRGTVRDGDTALAGARVRLRAGLLPSTVGVTGGAGAYQLLAREGRFEVRVLPAAGSGLPEAQLPESAGLDIPLQAGIFAVDFAYAPLPRGELQLTVVTPDNAPPAQPVGVLLESLEDELDNVGTFMLPSGPRAARGLVRQQKLTGAGGTVSFAPLPRARYRVTLIPPPDLPGDAAITTVSAIDLGAAGNGAVARTVALARRTRILGKLTPATSAANLTVRALDGTGDGITRAVTGLVGADGSYQLPVDPGRVYRLFVEPPPDRRLPRVPLVPVRARSTDVNDQQALPRRLSVQGTTLLQGAILGGVNLQIYCLGSAPDCIDTAAPDISNTPPIDETTSASDGKYQLYVPDPGS